ncbi:MAG TPA: prepilin-type N-terminal cleavage/methylation domain-containing protein [Burkholderiales bacterium]|jgi:prepilin-type N-terminal cleavage/methylation domain-containing protein
MRDRPSGRGFTLIELAMALFVMALLMGSVMYTLSAQNDQRMRTDSLRSLDEAKELVVTFAIVNGRLPCPASTASNGFESPAGGGACTNFYNGYLPARTIGFQPQDSSGYGLDAWGNRIRFAVSQGVPVNSQSPRVCRPVNPTTPPVTPHFTNKTNLRANGIDCAPSDLVVCAASSGIVTAPPGCNTAPSVTNQNVVAAVIWSQGKNFASSGYLGVQGQAGDDERVNNKTAANSNHAVFVAHPPAPSGTAGGEFDDLLTWIPAGQLYGRLVAAGVLP